MENIIITFKSPKHQRVFSDDEKVFWSPTFNFKNNIKKTTG